MSTQKTLGTQALDFAKRYVALTEALQSQGVPEDKAREEARVTALYMMFNDSCDEGASVCPYTNEVCPLGAQE